MTLHESALESILAVRHKSRDGNPDEVFGRDRGGGITSASVTQEGYVRRSIGCEIHS